MVQDEDNNTDIKHTTADFSISNVSELKSGKKLRLNGPLSSTKRDANGDIVSAKGQVKLVKQVLDRMKSKKHITMDLDHESHPRDKKDPLKSTGIILNKIPVAKFDHAELENEGDISKTNVKATLNEAHPLFDSIFKSIQNGFLHSFSIVYKVLDFHFEIISGKRTRVIDDLLLQNVGLTGVPVQEDASFTTELKSYLKKMEQEKEIQALSDSVTEMKSKIEGVETSNTEMKSQLTEKDTTITELKSQLKASNTSIDKKFEELNVTEMKSQLEKTVESVTEMKSLVDGLKAENEKLTATITEMKSKSIHKSPLETGASQEQDINLFSRM